MRLSAVVILAGEWVPAWVAFSATFLVATLGVAGLGWWVLRGDSINRAAEASLETPAPTEHAEAHSKSSH